MADPYPAQADRWIRRTTTASVLLLAAIAAVVSYRHMHALALAVGESPWTAALIPLSVDGMIVASSMTLLLDSRCGDRGEVLPWALLMTGSAASLAANVAVAEPTWCGRVIAAWPSFALMLSVSIRAPSILVEKGRVLSEEPLDLTVAQTEFDAMAGGTERLSGAVATRFVLKALLKSWVGGEVEWHGLDRANMCRLAGLGRPNASFQLVDLPRG